MELLVGVTPNEFADKSVWADNSRYYVEEKTFDMLSILKVKCS